MPHQIKVTDELYEQLRARAAGKPIPQLLRSLLENDTEDEVDEADAIMDRLEHVPTAEDQKIMEHLMPGELPECCQEIYSEEDPKEENMCEHWERAWVNFYGKQIWSLRNRLTGGSYQDYMQEYLG